MTNKKYIMLIGLHVKIMKSKVSYIIANYILIILKIWIQYMYDIAS